MKRCLITLIICLLFSSKTFAITGFPGYTWGVVSDDINGDTGAGISTFVNQGVDWFILPHNITFNTYAEYRYKYRNRDKYWYDSNGPAIGLEFRKTPFSLGAEYFWEKYTEQNKFDPSRRAYLTWYHDWYKYIRRRAMSRWFQIEAFSGSTWGRITYDFEGVTGAGVSTFINQGINWFTLPGEVTFNTYAEYRLSYRTLDKYWNNTRGPALGMEFQKSPFRLGMDYYWETYTEQKITNDRWRVYINWYYGWDLKPKK